MSGPGKGKVVTFYSYKGGVGRTMAMANVAWIIASNGKRVLAVDWDLESPGLHKFFHPFLDETIVDATPGIIEIIYDAMSRVTSPAPPVDNWDEDFAEVQRNAVSLDWEFPDRGTLDFLSAGRQNQEYSAAVCSLDWDNFYDRLGGGQFIRALRGEMQRNYDYILIDSRTGYSDVADICTIELPNVLTVCFTLSGQSIDGAADVAQRISENYADRGIRVLPLPMRIESDVNEQSRLALGRSLARTSFKGFPAGLSDEEASRYWTSVEVPYTPSYAFEERLATFADDPGSSTSLLAAYERITRWVTNGEIQALGPMDAGLRRRFLSAFARQQPAVSDQVYLSYVTDDFHWARCIQAILDAAGYRVVCRSADGGPERDSDAAGLTEIRDCPRAVAVLSGSYMSSPAGRLIWTALSAADATGVQRRLVPVLVKDVRVADPFAGSPVVDLAGLAVDQAAVKLIRELKMLRF